MAEEILYDEQVVTDNEGDPKDPLGLRKKLSATKKEKPDPLGLRAKLVSPKAVTTETPASHEQALALPKIDYSKPVFQENVAESTAIPQGATQALLATPPKETVAEKFENKVKQSRDKIFTEITTNDKAVENLIRKQRFDEAGRNDELPTSDMPVNGALAQDVARMVKPETRPQDLPITPEDLQQKKALIANDDSQARRLLEEVVRVDPSKKNEVQKSIYDLDVANAIQNDPEGQANVRKVLDNSKKIENGELVYDFRNGTLIKPLNAFQSALQGWKEGSKIRDEFSIFNKMNDGQLATMLDAQMATNQGKSKYDAVEVPEGLVGQMLQGLAMSPATTAGGAAGSLIGPEGAVAAGSILGAGEQSQRDYVLTLKRIYSELRAKGIDQLEAIKEAKNQALHAAGVGAVEGATFGFIGARLGVKPLPKAALTEGFRNAVVNSLKSAGKTISTATKEGLATGGIMAGGEMYKNHLAKEAGIDRDIDEGVAESIESNLLFTLGMAGAIKAMKVGGKAYKSLISGLSKADDAKISGSLNEMLQNNSITEQQATKLQEDINSFRKEDETIPENVAPEARMKILEKIQKRNELEKKMETTDKAFHPEIKEKIKAIEEEITGLSKETVKPEKTDKELHSLIDDAVEEGRLAGVMGNVAKTDPEGFMKFVADQALGRTETGEMSSLGDAEDAVRDQYGDAIVDKALEMFLLEKPKESSISVIRPEERTHPTETITIKPEENGTLQKSSPSGLLQHTQEGTGEAGSGRGGMEQGEQGEIIAGEKGANKEGETAGEEKVTESIQPNMYDLPFTPEEGDVTRLAHQDTEKIYKDLGLGDRIPRTEKTDITLEQQADDLIKKGYDFNRKADKIIGGEEHSFTDAEQVAFAKMVGALKVKANKIDVNSPEFDAIQGQIEKLSRASDIVGSEEGAAFRARRLFVLNDETLSDFMMKAKKANRNAPLTENQKAEVKESFEKVTKAKKKYEEAVEKQTDSETEKKAEETIKKVKSTAKKDVKKDYVAERKQIFADIKEKLKKSRGETSIVAIPYIKDLFVVAPDVAKLVKSLVEEGIDKLPDIIKNIHGQLKELIPDIKEKDIHDLIAGEYNKKKETKNKIQEQVYDLQLQAKLINKLEALENGVSPKNENQKRKRSREVEELRTKIKGLQKELGTDKNALQSLKTRIKNKLAELQEKLKNKDYEPDVKSEPIVLDKEAQDLQDQYIAEKKKWDLEVARQDYNNRPLKEKAWDKITGVLDLRRAIGTALDFSVPFRQALPVTINPLKIKTTADAFGKMFSHFASEKNLDRWWFDLEKSPDYKAMIDDGLPVKSPNELRLSKREEEFRTNLAEEIPVLGKAIKASNRAASGYLNTMRVDLYRKGTEMLKEQGVTRANNPEAYKKLASGIGDLTGSGKIIGPLQGKPEQLLGNIFFGPKLMAAKFNLLNPYRYATMPKHIRIRALRDLGVRVGMYVGIGSLAKAAGWSVSLDPNDPDFLKIKHGNTTYDITGGEAIYVRTALRILAAAYKRVTTPNATEKDTQSAVNKAAYSTTSFFRNKLAPTPAYLLDAFTGKKSYGAPFDPYDIVRLYPMWIDDMTDDWKQEGPNSILAAAIPSIFGIGVQTKAEEKAAKSSGKSSKHSSKTNKKVSHKK